jgi:hypothetical protein
VRGDDRCHDVLFAQEEIPEDDIIPGEPQEQEPTKNSIKLKSSEAAPRMKNIFENSQYKYGYSETARMVCD